MNGAAVRAADEVLRAASRHPLASQVARSLESAGVEPEERLLLMVSGGGDSMAMLVLVAALRARLDRGLSSLAVCTIDHGLRETSAREAAFVVAEAHAMGVVEARAVRVDVARTGNLLDAARQARLAAMQAEAQRIGARVALLAHQADDAAESLVMALGRGGGFEALTAILPRRALERSGVALVRPLLGTRREQLRAFLREVGVGWIEDPSNETRTRGALRADPSIRALLDRIASGAHGLLDEAAAIQAWRAEETRRVLASRPGGGLPLERGAVDALPRALRSEVLRALVHEAGGQLARPVLQAALDALDNTDRAPRVFHCAGGVELRVDARGVSCARL